MFLALCMLCSLHFLHVSAFCLFEFLSLIALCFWGFFCYFHDMFLSSPIYHVFGSSCSVFFMSFMFKPFLCFWCHSCVPDVQCDVAYVQLMLFD